jgi:hypothetical protein
MAVRSTFEIVGSEISKTQLALLRHLDSHGPQSESALRNFIAELEPDKAGDFTSLMELPTQAYLLKQDGGGAYELTSFGREFLAYAEVNVLAKKVQLGPWR